MFGLLKPKPVDGAPFPSPETVDVLAEVSEWRTGKNIGRSPLTISGLARYVVQTRPESADHRDALVRLAATAIARIELIDNKEKV